MYETSAVIGAVATAAVAGGVTHVLVGRHARGWTAAIRVGGGAYRSNEVEVPVAAPPVVRAAAGLAVLGLATGLLRAILVAPELFDLVDGPHVDAGLVPGSPLLASFHSLYALMAIAASFALAPVIGASLRAGPFEGLGLTLVAAVVPLAACDAWLVRETCASIYWVDRMVAYSSGHAIIALAALVAALLALRRQREVLTRAGRSRVGTE